MKYEFGVEVFGIKETEIFEYPDDTPIEEIKEAFDEWRFNWFDSWMVPVVEEDAQ